MLKCNVKYRYLSILIIGVLLACSSNEKAKLPEAKKGILDLRGWDFKIDGPVALNGEWEYYWQKLYNPKDFDSISPMTDGYMKVPGKWFESATDGRSLPLYGYMTYRLIVLTNPFSDKLIFYASRAPATACQVYINDQLVAENGLPGTRKELSHPAGVLDCESFTTEGDTLQVIITISNFHSGFDAGLFNEIKLGESKVLSKSKEREQLQLNFSIGIYLFLTISYLLLFHFLPKNKAILYFSLFIFCLLVASLYSNGTLYRIILFPSSLYKPFETIWIYAIFIIGPTFFIYINTLYKLDMKQIKLEKLYVSYAIIVLVFLLTWQFGLNANLNFGIFILDTFTYLTVIFFIAALYLLILARLRKKDYAIHNIISIAFFLMSVAIAAFHEGSQRVVFFNIGSIVFLVMQAYILSAGFVSTFNKNLELKNELMFLNQNLQHLVDERTHQLDEQKEELQVANMQLEKHQKEIEEVNTILEEQKEELMQQKEELQSTLENLQKTQEQLIESEKMAAIGGLVAGVAHEINTPVGIGITAISNLQDDIQRMAGLYEKDEISRKISRNSYNHPNEVV